MTRKKKRQKSGNKSIKPFIAALATIITLVCLAGVLLLPPQEEKAVITDSTPASSAPDRSENKKAPREDKKYTFEEKLTPNFDQKVRQADLVLTQVLAEFGEDSEMEHQQIRTRKFHGVPYHFQTLDINLPHSPEPFLQKLRDELKKFVDNSSLEPSPEEKSWSICINGEKTHEIHLKFKRKEKTKPQRASGAQLAIIIDDMGRNRDFARGLAQLDYPITFSVLPHSSSSREVRRIARKSGKPIMLHLPMQPESWPETDPGAGALFTDMSASEIEKTVRKDLRQVPEAIGVNNHMGSRFTADTPGMRSVFRVLKQRGMFFVDSLTTPHSVAEKIASQNSIPLLKRNIFLDNIHDQRAIAFQLRKAEQVARNTGRAIAIGHPYPETLSALRSWDRDQQVKIVPIKEML